jgi:hypothetical protein
MSVFKKIWIPERNTLQKKSQAELQRILDGVFSQWVRRKFADHAGNVACFTCGKVKHWTEIQNGHFVKRGNLCTRFSETNCNPQCGGCNGFKGGNLEVYREKLDELYGDGTAEELESFGRKTCKMTRSDFIEKIIHYDNELDRL